MHVVFGAIAHLVIGATVHLVFVAALRLVFRTMVRLAFGSAYLEAGVEGCGVFGTMAFGIEIRMRRELKVYRLVRKNRGEGRQPNDSERFFEELKR